MAAFSKISWTHHTFNCWWGCVKVSPACLRCYAEVWAKRTGWEVWGPESRRRFFGDAHWREPLKWDRDAAIAGERRRVFCASMADVFEVLSDDHPDRAQMERERERLFFDLVRATPNLDWLILTKRPDVMAEYFSTRAVPDNVIAMTTAENQEWLDRRIEHLLDVPARRRALSLEPLLGPIRLDTCAPHILDGEESNPGVVNAFNGMSYHPQTIMVEPPKRVGRGGVSWVIVGGESGGRAARLMQPEWVRSLRDQCIVAGAAFHFKQWGNWKPSFAIHDYFDNDQETNFRAGDHTGFEFCHDKHDAGRELDGRTWDEIPPEVRAA